MTVVTKDSWWTAIRKHPRHFVAIVCVLLVGALFFQPHLGYDWGPYKVGRNETLSELLVHAMNDNTYLAFASVNYLRDQQKINPDTLWKNNEYPIVEGGDTVSIAGNTLTIIKPNGTQIHSPLFPARSYVKRIAQVVTGNAMMTILILTIVTLIAEHTKNGLQLRALATDERRLLMKFATLTHYGVAAMFTILCAPLILFGFFISAVFLTLLAPWSEYNGVVQNWLAPFLIIVYTLFTFFLIVTAIKKVFFLYFARLLPRGMIVAMSCLLGACASVTFIMILMISHYIFIP